MDEKIYKFKPLYNPKSSIIFFDALLIVCSLVLGFLILFYHFTSYSVFIIVALAIRIHFFKNSAKRWLVDGYNLIKIDGIHNFIFLDNLAIPFSKVNYAEVIFEERPSVGGLSDGVWQYSELVNSKVILSLENGDSISIPVQMKSILQKMVVALKEYIAVKCDDYNELAKGGYSSWKTIIGVIGVIFFIYMSIPTINQ